MLGPTTRPVEKRGSSTVNVSASRIAASARSRRVTSHASSAGSHETGSCSRRRASKGCGSASSSSTVAEAPIGKAVMWRVCSGRCTRAAPSDCKQAERAGVSGAKAARGPEAGRSEDSGPLPRSSGRRDLNSGPPVPQTGALTRLRHAPSARMLANWHVEAHGRALRPSRLEETARVRRRADDLMSRRQLARTTATVTAVYLSVIAVAFLLHATSPAQYGVLRDFVALAVAAPAAWLAWAYQRRLSYMHALRQL